MGKFLDKTGLATFWTKCKDTFVKKSGPSTITGDMGTITFDPNGGNGESGGVSECGIQIKMDDECYAKLEPASLDIKYYNQHFYLSGEEGLIDINNYSDGSQSSISPGGLSTGSPEWSIGMWNGYHSSDFGKPYIEIFKADGAVGYYYTFPEYSGTIAVIDENGNMFTDAICLEEGLYIGPNDEVQLDISQFSMGSSDETGYYSTYFNAGKIRVESPFSEIYIDSGNEDDSAASIKILNKDDPDNANSCISSTSIWINAYGSYFEVSPEDGYFALYNDHYSTYLNYGSIWLHGPDGDIIIDAANNSLSSGAHLGRIVGGNRYEYTLPNKSGTIALTNDFKTINGQSIIGSGDITISGGSSDKTYQHDIYIMPGNSNTGGVYIYLTLNINKSTKISSVADLCSVLYNRGNNVQQQAVSATGKAGSSSTSFSGFIVGVWASSTSTLNVVYVTTTGTLTTTSYSASMFTSMRDTVN